MDHWVEITRIIEGALRSDQEKVIAYTKHLANKLRGQGEVRHAARLERLLLNPRTATLQPSSLSTLETLPVDQDSRFPLGDAYTPDVLEPSVILGKEVEDAIHLFCRYYEEAGRLESAGAPVRPTAILYGPPGCGKTQTAFAIAKRLNLPIVVARLDTLVSSYLGNTAKNLRLLFDYANRQPTVLFLDEFDALAKLRDDRNELGELKRVVNSLLQNVDNLDESSVLLAATNHPHLLDPAVWRRFYFRISVDKPDDLVRSKIIRHYLGPSNMTFGTDDIDVLVTLFKDASPSDIRDVCQDAIRASVIENTSVSTARVIDSFLRLRSLTGEGTLGDRDDRVRWLHQIEPKVFSVTRLAQLTGLAKSSISRILKRS